MTRLPILCLLPALIAGPALAEEEQDVICDTRAKITAFLVQEYDEAPLGVGINGSGLAVELWTNPTTGTWTMFMSGPDGRSCLSPLNGTGGDWQAMPQSAGL